MQRVRAPHVLVLAAALLGAAGCSDEPASSLGSETAAGLVAGPSSPIDVPEVRIDLPPTPRAWDSDDAALAEAVARGNGIVIVGFKEPGSRRALETGIRAGVGAPTITAATAVVRASGAEILTEYRSMGAVAARIDPSLAPRLRKDPLVDFVEPAQEYRTSAVVVPEGPARAPGATAGVDTIPWAVSQMRAPDAWPLTTGTGVKVMIQSSGYERYHADLPVVPDVNCGGVFGGCDDGPNYWFGTHQIGDALARSNGTGYLGVAYGVESSNVYPWAACDANYACWNWVAIDGLNAAGYAGVKVVTMNFWGPYDIGMATAISQAWNAGIVLIAPAGDFIPTQGGGGTPQYPAVHTHVLGVSGVRPDRSFANPECGNYASNYGPHVDIAAGFWGWAAYANGSYSGLCSTFVTSSYVAGAAALVRAYHPTYSAQQVVDALLSTAVDLGSGGRDDLFGYGLVDALTAVQYVPPPPCGVTTQGPGTASPYEWVTVSASTSYCTSPISYAWTVNGSPTCGNQSSCTAQVGDEGSYTYFGVTVTDGHEATASASHTVFVPWSGCPECMRPRTDHLGSVRVPVERGGAKPPARPKRP